MDTADTAAPYEDCGILPGMRLWIYHGISLDDCYIPVGAILSVPYNQKEEPMDPTVSVPTTAPLVSEPVAPVDPVEATAPATPAVTEHIEVPAAPAVPSAEELGKVAQSAGDSSTGLLLALLAVVGSAGAFKFYTDWRKQSHELAMKKLDVEAEAASAKAPDYTAAQPPPCAAEKVAVEKRLAGLTEAVEALSARVAKTEKAAASFGGADLDDYEDRLTKLEKTLKAKARSAGTK
jgi:hypothetical protein